MAVLENQGPETGGTIKAPTVRREKVRISPQGDRVGTGEFVDVPDLSGLSPNQIKSLVQRELIAQQQSSAIGVPTAAERQRRKDFLDFPQPERQLPVFNNQPGKFLMVDEYGNPIQQQQQQPAVDTERRKFAFGVDPTGRRIQQQPDQISGMGQLRSRVAAVPGFLEYFGLTPDQINVMPEGTIANMLRRFLQDAGGPDVSGVSQLQQGGIGQPPMPPQMVIEQMLTGLGAQDSQLLQELGRTPVQTQPMTTPTGAPVAPVAPDIEPTGIQAVDEAKSNAATNINSTMTNLGLAAGEVEASKTAPNFSAAAALLDNKLFDPFMPLPKAIEDGKVLDTPITSIRDDRNIAFLANPVNIGFLNQRASEGTLTNQHRTLLTGVKAYLQLNYPDLQKTGVQEIGGDKVPFTFTESQDAGFQAMVDSILAEDDTVKGASQIAAQLGLSPAQIAQLESTTINALIADAGEQRRFESKQELEILTEVGKQQKEIREETATETLLRNLYGDVFDTANLGSLPSSVQSVLAGKAPMFRDPPEADDPPEEISPYTASLLSLLTGVPSEQIAGTARGELGSISQLLQLLPKTQTDERVTPTIRMLGGG
jgi:hypothetical protein